MYLSVWVLRYKHTNQHRQNKINQLETSALWRWVGFTKDMHEGLTGCIKTRTMKEMSTKHDKKKRRNDKKK